TDWRRRWPIRPEPAQTVADPPRTGADGGRSADISPACRVGSSTTVCASTATVVDPPPVSPPVDGHPGGAAATVDPTGQTVADKPTRHAVPMSADRPPSGTRGGRSTTVCGKRWQIDHRQGRS